MTRQQVIDRVKRDRPGESTDAELNLWLDQLDMRWTDEVLETHWGSSPDSADAILATNERTWKSADGTATAGGLTAVREGNLLKISGTSTDNVLIRLNGESIEAVQGMNPPSAWRSGMVGPGEHGYQIYSLILNGNGETVYIGFLSEDTSIDAEFVILPAAGETDTKGDLNADNASIFLWITSGTTFPEGWTLWMMIPEERDPDWPEDWAERVRRHLTRQLLIPEIDEEVYIHWLYAKIDYRLGEMERYNNDAAMFNTDWDAAAKRWHRQHLPKGRQVIHNVYGHPFPWHPVEDPLNQRGDWAKY